MSGIKYSYSLILVSYSIDVHLY